MPNPSRKNDVIVQYRKNLADFRVWEDQERERQDEVIARARMEYRERTRYFNPLRWLRERVRWMKWFSL